MQFPTREMEIVVMEVNRRRVRRMIGSMKMKDDEYEVFSVGICRRRFVKVMRGLFGERKMVVMEMVRKEYGKREMKRRGSLYFF